MLRWFRTRARLAAAALLVSLGTLGASSIVPHEDDCHGGLCAFPAAPHDPSEHSLRNASSRSDHTWHCVVCHWTRLHRPSAQAVRQIAPSIERHARVVDDAIAVAPVFPAAQPPLRSPPDAPLRFV
jgi:hypothetical protein